jgi:hypothetical protein
VNEKDIYNLKALHTVGIIEEARTFVERGEGRKSRRKTNIISTWNHFYPLPPKER